MKRKLVRQAGQAVTITLPIEWVRENNLKPGDEIDLETTGKKLLLKSDSKTLTGSLDLDLTGFSRRMSIININAAYARGIDKIKVKTNQYPDLNQNIGYVVVSQKTDSLIIKDVSGQSDENPEKILKRAFQIIIGFLDSAIDDIFEKQKAKLETPQKIDFEVNRFILLLHRSIMKHSSSDNAMGKIMFAYAYNLEKISDEIQRLWRKSILTKITRSKKIKDIIMLAKTSLEKSFELYFQSNAKKVEEILKIREDIKARVAKLIKQDTNTGLFAMHAVKIAEDSFDLSPLALMKKMMPL